MMPFTGSASGFDPAASGGGVPASVAPQGAPPAVPTLSASETSTWWTRVDLARQRRKREFEGWKQLLEAYLPPKSTAPNAINSNIHFRNVQSKKAQLFFQLPELQLTPLPALQAFVDPQTWQAIDADRAVAAKRDLLNKLLGRDYANVKKAAIDPALFDVLQTSAIGATKICYQVDLQEVPQEVPGPDQSMHGSVLGLQTVPGPTVTQTTSVPVYERFRWYRFSTAKLLIPHDFHATDYDEAPWLGMEFVIPLAEAVAAGYVTADYVPTATRDDLILEAGTKDPGQGSASLVKGIEIWLRASVYDATVSHSQVFRQLVLVEGQKDKPSVYRLSPYQTIGPDNALTPDSMIGNPIHPLVVRGVSDSAWPPSDAAFTDPLVRQANTWAAQDIKIRDSNIPRFFHRASIADAVDKLSRMDTGQGAEISDEDADRGIEHLLVQVPHMERAESDVRGQANIKQAIDETLGLNANAAGTLNQSKRSATEIVTVAQNVSVRLQDERTNVLEWFLLGVRKFDALVTRYGDLNNLTPIVGAQDAALILAWHSIGGRNAFDAKPDSQLSLDAAADRKNILDYQNFNAKNPMVDQLELSKVVALKFGLDPGRLVREPPPPPPPPEPPPKISASFTAADLGVPEVRQLLGLPAEASPEALLHVAALKAAAVKPATHGGAADQVDKLSKHHGELTGGMPGAVPNGAPQAPAPVGVQ